MNETIFSRHSNVLSTDIKEKEVVPLLGGELSKIRKKLYSSEGSSRNHFSEFLESSEASPRVTDVFISLEVDKTKTMESAPKKSYESYSEHAPNKYSVNILTPLDTLQKNISDNNFNNLIEIEINCFKLISLHGDILSKQTHTSLIYLYAKIISYLLSRSSENYPNWLGFSAEKIRNRVKQITYNIKKANAVEYFENSLNIKILCDENGNFVRELVDIQSTKEKLKSIDTAVNIGSMLMASGIGIAMATPAIGIGIGYLTANVLLSCGYAASNEYYKELRNVDYNNYYNEKFSEINKDTQVVIAAARKEIEYYKLKRDQNNIFSQIIHDSENLLHKYYLEISSQEKISDEENELLGFMRSCLAESQSKNFLLTEVQKEKLKSLGFDINDIDESNVSLFLELIDNEIPNMVEKPVSNNFANSSDKNQQLKINSLLDSIGKADDNSYFLSEDIKVTRGEVKHSIIYRDNHYTGDFINILLSPISQNHKNNIKIYPAITAKQLQAYFTKIQEQKEPYAFFPLNVAYDEKNTIYKNHWTALILDKKNGLIFYLDPARIKTGIPESLNIIKSLMGYKKPLILNPIDFLKQNEKKEGWISHCGVYAVEIFKHFADAKQCISGSLLADEDIPDSIPLQMILSPISCGEADNIKDYRESHIEEAHNVIIAKNFVEKFDEVKSYENIEHLFDHYIVRKNFLVVENPKNWGSLINRQMSKYAFCFFDTNTLKIASVGSRNSYIIAKEIETEREESRNCMAGR